MQYQSLLFALCLTRSRNDAWYLDNESSVRRIQLCAFEKLNAGTASEARASVAVAPPVGARGEDGNEPEESTGEVNPDGVLHAHDMAVAVSLLLDVDLYAAR